MRRAKGFTLVELVVVLGIFSVMSVLAYGGLRSVLTARERVTESLERTADLQKTYLRMRGDFQQLRDRPIRDEFAQVRPAVEGLDSLPGTPVIEFTRAGWRNPTDQARSTLQRVGYLVDDKQRLIRLGWPTLDRVERPEPGKTVLLDKVKALRFRYLDRGGAWHERWPDAAVSAAASPGTPAPPGSGLRAVEATLELEDLGEIRWLFTDGRN